MGVGLIRGGDGNVEKRERKREEKRKRKKKKRRHSILVLKSCANIPLLPRLGVVTLSSLPDIPPQAQLRALRGFSIVMIKESKVQVALAQGMVWVYIHSGVWKNRACWHIKTERRETETAPLVHVFVSRFVPISLGNAKRAHVSSSKFLRKLSDREWPVSITQSF